MGASNKRVGISAGYQDTQTTAHTKRQVSAVGCEPDLAGDLEGRGMRRKPRQRAGAMRSPYFEPLFAYQHDAGWFPKVGFFVECTSSFLKGKQRKPSVFGVFQFRDEPTCCK